MSEWQKVKLEDISTSIQTGPFGSQLHQSDYSEKGVPVVMPKDIIDGKVDDSSIARVEMHHIQRLSRYTISEGDILYPRRGDVGKCAFISAKQNGWLCGTGCLRVSINQDKANSRFIFFQLQKRDTIGWIENHAIGATMLNLNTSILSNVPIELPTLNTQRRIAEILSRYDSLIENYQRQIKLLEEAAQRLYKEWFVDLHFPGHENTPIIDGIPEGWEKKTVGECLVFHGNGGWGKETSVGKNEYPGKVIRGTDIEDIKGGNFGGIPLRYHTENDIKKRTLKSFDIVFELSNGNINNIGRCLLIDDIILQNCGQNTICASFCKLLRPIDKIHAFTLFWEIQDMQTSGRMLPLKKQGANGINNFDFDGFLNHTLLVPSNNLMLESIASIMKRISIIIGQFALLTEARDRLLPKLMSGEIDIV